MVLESVPGSEKGVLLPRGDLREDGKRARGLFADVEAIYTVEKAFPARMLLIYSQANLF